MGYAPSIGDEFDAWNLIPPLYRCLPSRIKRRTWCGESTHCRRAPFQVCVEAASADSVGELAGKTNQLIVFLVAACRLLRAQLVNRWPAGHMKRL